jgi:type III secretion system low calcium response chaperone LcrH/SycD
MKATARTNTPKGKPRIQMTDAQFTALCQKFIKGGHTLKGLKGISNKTMEAVYAIAYARYNSGKFDEAVKLFAFLGAFDPYKKKYWLGLAAARQMTKDYQGAIHAYSMAALVAPKDPRAPLYAADCYLILNNKKMAANALEAALEISKSQPEFADIEKRAQTLLELIGHRKGAGEKAPATAGA